MSASEVEIASFIRLQEGIRVRKVSLEVELGEADQLSTQGTVLYGSVTGGSRFLLHPLLNLESVLLDETTAPFARMGPMVQLSDSPGAHRLTVKYAGTLTSNGGLGISGTSFDLNANLLWYPILVGGSRLDVDLEVRLPHDTSAIFPPVGRRRGRRMALRSVIDVPLVGGRIQGRSLGRGLAVYSLVRRETRNLYRIAEDALAWQERRWGPRPFRPLRVVETWRDHTGAYAREGLIVTQNLSDESVEGVSQKLIHETTHQWWGMDALPGERWFREDWLSEGLATYCEYLWIQEKLGEPRADDFLKDAGRRVSGMKGSLVAASPWTSDGWSLTRYGGLLALVALERQVPDLSDRLRRFRSAHAGSFLTTEGLVHDLSPDVAESWLQSHLLATRTWPGDLLNPDG